MPNGKKPTAAQIKKLRSRQWFDNPDNPDMTALYLERYMNYGLTREELSSGKPIIGIAQSGSDLSPCNRHHLELANAVVDDARADWRSRRDAARGHRRQRKTLRHPKGQRRVSWSERQDLNLRPLDPQSSALPSCATLRR